MDSAKVNEVNSPRSEEMMLSRGDRVVVMFDNFQEYGWVRWVGRKNSHDSGSELMAGVEFDNPVGNDNHKLSDHTLFETPPNHGSLVPASSLIQIEEFWPRNSSHFGGKGSNCKKHNSKIEPALGSDMSSLSAFHKMAYEQLSGKTGSGKGFPSPSAYNDKENWSILPHMSYTSPRNMYNGSKETLNDLRSKPVLRMKTRSGGTAKNLSSLLNDDRRQAPAGDNCPRNSATTSPPSCKLEAKGGHVRPSTLLSSSPRETPTVPIGFGGGGIIGREDDREFDSSPTPAALHPLYHLSHNGVDQLEVVSDGEDGSPTSSPTLDGDWEGVSIGSLVEVVLRDGAFVRDYKPLFGVIRWIGSVPGDKKEGRRIAGIEMEDLEDGLSDGTLKGKRYFTCHLGKALFVPLTMCAKDRRFLEPLHSNPRASLAFGSVDCQPVMGAVPPIMNAEEVKAMFGRNRGIQGHQNSCYLDATLFSMFAFTSVFDSLLFRPPTATDIKEYLEVQTVLREEIVNPLRKNMYVRADRIMKLRTMLDHLSSVRGLTTEEKDPEEFLHSLLAQILQADPLLQLSSGQEAYHYQLFVEKDDKLNLPSVQTLFDQSFLASDIKLKQIPSCLIIQMPRFGKDYKMYPRILPSMLLDVTDVIEDSPRQCIICGKLAEFECKECYGHCGSGLESIAFCTKCMDKVHSHKKRGYHKSTKKLKIPPEFQMLADHCGSIPRVYMELFAVVCIETSHYVAFTRCGSGADATWCFFDSMADRKGEQHGYNIPTVVECGGLMQWVGDEGSQTLHTVTDNRSLPDLPRRLLCDAYMCFYQSPQIMMYR